MFLKQLIISTEKDVIRTINFKMGLNLIVDDVVIAKDMTKTGNNVGKTTVLKLIYYCFGGNEKEIYTSTENTQNEYEQLKSFLINNKVNIKLIISRTKNYTPSEEIMLERTFGEDGGKIDSQFFSSKDYIHQLSNLIFPNLTEKKPTFKQLISHNFRYKDYSINNTLKTLHTSTKSSEYEYLNLFLFGCPLKDVESISEIEKAKKEKTKLLKELEKETTRNGHVTLIEVIQEQIKSLENEKEHLLIADEVKDDIKDLSALRERKIRLNGIIERALTKKIIIEKSIIEMEKTKSNIDSDELKMLFQETKEQQMLNKTFKEMENFHNAMIDSKIRFIKKEIPELNETIQKYSERLKELETKEEILVKRLSKKGAFEGYIEIEKQLFKLYEDLGEHKGQIDQIDKVKIEIDKLDKQINEINEYKNTLEKNIEENLKKFNSIFSKMSMDFYNESYALKYEKREDKTNETRYEIGAYTQNMSSGKKQGEIMCFDLSYCQFADKEKMPTLHFLLNDKKELLHDNQLIKLLNYANTMDVQLVISILRDKLPNELNNKKDIILELSQDDKLFKMEQALVK